MAANSPRGRAAGAGSEGLADEAAKAAASAASSGTKRSVEELEADIAKLREDISRLTAHIKDTGRHSVSGAKRAAEDLRAQGEAAMDDLRERSSDMQQQVEDKVREKPITALAVAAAVGYVLAILTRR